MNIREDVEIALLTTMRLGGRARYVIEIEELADVVAAYDFAKEKGLPTFVLGGGANAIGRDEGFDGVILLNRLRGIEIVDETSEEVLVRAGAGEVWDDLVAYACERGLSGVEAMSKIPGTVGAAPVQNIGAYGQDLASVVDHVEAYDTKKGEMVILGRDEMKMDYRKTIFNHGKDAGRYFIAAVTMALLPDEEMEPPFYNSLQKYIETHGETDFSPENIRRMVTEIRAAKLPDPEKIASAGSFFKNIYLNPAEAEAAEERGIKVWQKSEEVFMINSGWLIEQAGLLGKEFFGFRVSDKAALVLINEDGKTYENLARARAEIRRVVKEKFGFLLEQEPVEIETEETGENS